MKGAQRDLRFLAAAHPSDPRAQKGNMKGAQWELVGRGPPIRPRSSSIPRGSTNGPRAQKRNMTVGRGPPIRPNGAQFLAAAHPCAQERRAQLLDRAVHPSDADPESETRKHEGSQTGAQLLGRGPPIRPRSAERKYERSPMGARFFAEAHPSHPGPRKKET